MEIKKFIKAFLAIFLLSIIFSTSVHAAGVGEFIGNLIPDSITKSLEGMRIFFYDFMSFILDLFTILLFIIWILCIAGIVYVVYYIITLPQKLGADNFHDAMMQLSMRLWRFMR